MFVTLLKAMKYVFNISITTFFLYKTIDDKKVTYTLSLCPIS